MSINVAIVENDGEASGVLARCINATEGFQCTGRYSHVAAALDEFAVSLPNVILMDLELPGVNGVEGVRRIKETCPDQPVLVLTNLDDPQIVFKTLSAGAAGYLLKTSSSPRQITDAIREVFRGGAPLTSSVARRLVNLFQQVAAVPGSDYRKLTLREHQVLDLLARGLRYQEVAWQLGIAYATAHSHIRHIYRKLQVNCRMDAVTLYLRQSPHWQIEMPARQAGLRELIGGSDFPEHYAQGLVQAAN